MTSRVSVKIDYFKDIGKWYSNEDYISLIPGYEHDLLIEEAERKFPHLKEYNYTIRCEYKVSGGNALNFRLVLNVK